MNDRPHTVIGVLPRDPAVPERERRLHADGGMPDTLLARASSRIAISA